MEDSVLQVAEQGPALEQRLAPFKVAALQLVIDIMPCICHVNEVHLRAHALTSLNSHCRSLLIVELCSCACTAIFPDVGACGLLH
jgi:hypothetical protein